MEVPPRSEASDSTLYVAQYAQTPNNAVPPQGMQSYGSPQQNNPYAGAPNSNTSPSAAGYPGNPSAMPPSGIRPASYSSPQIPIGYVPNQNAVAAQKKSSIIIFFFGASVFFAIWALLRFIRFCCDSEIRKYCHGLHESIVLRFFTLAFDFSVPLSFKTIIRDLLSVEFYRPTVTLFLMVTSFVLFIVGALIRERQKPNGPRSFKFRK